MRRRTYAPQARRDLERIYADLAAAERVAAMRLLATVRDMGRYLADNPLGGHALPGLGPDLWSCAVGTYLIICRPAKGGVEIVRIIHGAQDIEAISGGGR